MSKELINPVKIVVDLLEIKARSMQPFSPSEYESGMGRRVHYEYQYAIIGTAIALICDKYNVRSQEIEDEINERHLMKNI